VAAIALHTLGRGLSTLIVVPDQRDEDQVLAVLASDSRAMRSSETMPAARDPSATPRTCAFSGSTRGRRRQSVDGVCAAPDVGAVIVWDDGDPLLAEPLSPGIHARDAALVRQELEESALVFAGHTRTSDVERLVQIGWVAMSRAPSREPECRSLRNARG
jgi:primosomal protein N' (replication factor Y)